MNWESDELASEFHIGLASSADRSALCRSATTSRTWHTWRTCWAWRVRFAVADELASLCAKLPALGYEQERLARPNRDTRAERQVSTSTISSTTTWTTTTRRPWAACSTFSPLLVSLASLFLHYMSEAECYACLLVVVEAKNKLTDTGTHWTTVNQVFRRLAQKYAHMAYDILFDDLYHGAAGGTNAINVCFEVIDGWQLWIFEHLLCPERKLRVRCSASLSATAVCSRRLESLCRCLENRESPRRRSTWFSFYLSSFRHFSPSLTRCEQHKFASHTEECADRCRSGNIRRTCTRQSLWKYSLSWPDIYIFSIETIWKNLNKLNEIKTQIHELRINWFLLSWVLSRLFSNNYL